MILQPKRNPAVRCSAWLGGVEWEVSRFKGGRKWVCWKMCAWVTARKDQPLHVGLGQKYLGTWDCSPEQARDKLEQMYRGHMAAMN